MTTPHLEIIRLAEVRRRTGLPNTTVYRLVAAGKFPRQVKLGARISGWVASEVNEWIASRIAAREAATREFTP
jgi:prophage regulatory protein